MEKVKSLFRKNSLSILAGFLIGTSYIPFPPWAVFFCLVPLWLQWWRSESLKEILLSGWIAQFILTLIGFHWVAHTAQEFGHLPLPLAVLVLIGYCSVANLYFPVAGALFYGFRKFLSLSHPLQVLGLVLSLFILETFFPAIFPWNFGYSWLWAKFPAFQLADTIGFRGLSLFTIAFNAILFSGWLAGGRTFKMSLGIFASLFLLLNIAGWMKQSSLEEGDRTLKVLQIQANIGNFEKYYAERGTGYQLHIFNIYKRLTEEGLAQHPETDFIVWPETAYPSHLDSHFSHRKYPRILKKFVQSLEKPLLTGAYSKDPQSLFNKKKSKTYNGLFVLNSQGELVAPPYRKSILLAFGEYFPLGDQFPILYKLVPAVSNFGRGSGAAVVNWDDYKIGAQICYEGLYPSYSREIANLGAHFFVNLTNDSWFGTLFEPYQHGYMTFARAIEFRRPMIRNTNTGISSVMLANGELLEQSPLHQEWFGYYEIPIQEKPTATAYQRWGIFIPEFCAVLFTLLSLMGLYGRQKS